jgi:hypothetical protein
VCSRRQLRDVIAKVRFSYAIPKDIDSNTCGLGVCPSPKPEDYIAREVEVEGRTDAALIKSHAMNL